ncbi:Retrovirus-related Pol polyprotein from type-1 retrotransposable element R1 [Eumeta japonica]|uniref:Retrovirus-related Pol polyprotein from type-1 retrotransposable element R1 n=1 Tax=Eumeta variegata TaxID=151549 RepID=A0A4C1SV37_EUMVA|nr:Retrovirus-related Pol polyprotein from type-1 retrotransposable element R1 [Eumeta japonica]
MLGDPSNEDILTGLYEQNLRVRDPTWTLDRLKKVCKIAFKKSRRDRPITTVVLECSPELRDLLVSMDRAFIGWEAVQVCDYIDVTCCHKCQQYGHPAAHCRSKDVVCGSGGVTRKRTEPHRESARRGSSPKKDTYPSLDMDRRGKLRVGQINLGGSADATRELPETARRLGLDLVLVQEQYAAAENLIQTGSAPKAGIMTTRANLTITALTHLSTQHCMVVHVGPNDLYVVSGYLQYSDRIDPYLEQLNFVLNSLRGRRVIIADGGFIAGRGLTLHNRENQPATFAGARGESNIDLTLSTRGIEVSDWRVLEEASVSDHRLIVFRVDGAERAATSAEPIEEPVRFRDRGVDWDEFERVVQVRVGRIRWGAAPAAKVAGSFTDVIISSARECLGVIRPRSYYGYEWWNEELDRMRGMTAKKRKIWQRAKVRGGDYEVDARLAFLRARSAYRRRMRDIQTAYFRQIAESGNVDPWGMAYRAASGRCRAPRNVVNGLALAEGFAVDTAGAMSGMLRSLCPDDDPAGDSGYHRLVRVAAMLVPSGRDVGPVGGTLLGKIVGSLPNTAPGLDGIGSRIIKHVWKAAQQEFCEVYDRCVKEGVFPNVWKSGRLLVIPKGNGKPATDPKAYRPITLLPVLGKILERTLLELVPELRGGISKNQHGFVPGRSTSTALNDILGCRGSAAKCAADIP